MKVYSLTVRNRLAAALLTLVILGVGAALLLVGFMLLAGLAVAGALAGAGAVVYTRLHSKRDAVGRGEGVVLPRLDPADEIHPDRSPPDRLPPG